MSVRISWLKRKLAKLYREHLRAMSGYDCGYELAGEISLRISQIRSEFNDIADELKRIDPECPESLKL